MQFVGLLASEGEGAPESSKLWTQLHNGSASAIPTEHSSRHASAMLNQMAGGAGGGLINPSSHGSVYPADSHHGLEVGAGGGNALEVIAENGAPSESRPSGDPMNSSRPTVIENRPIDDNEVLRVSDVMSSKKEEVKDEW